MKATFLTSLSGAVRNNNSTQLSPTSKLSRIGLTLALAATLSVRPELDDRSSSSTPRWTKAPSDSSGRLCHHAIRLLPSKLRQPLG